MTYSQTLDYIYSALPMYSRVGDAAYKKDLFNIRILCDHLGNPEKKFKTIHVGGTNGKGSVSHMLAAVFQTAGYKTGLYTSPHLYDFRERIRVNGIMVTETFVVEFVERIKPLIEKIAPSFFEITVAMAFEYYAREKVDMAIIEVGLGGRLDSTNIIIPELSVITNIGWDHMNLLGNRLEEIAFEKAGIIKENVPVVIGEHNSETDHVFESVAKEKKAVLYFAGDRFQVMDYQLEPQLIDIAVFDKETCILGNYELDLPGLYQTKNIVTVFRSVEILDRAYNLNKSLREGLRQVKKMTKLFGRWDRIQVSPGVIMDVAHNREGISALMRHLDHLKFEKLHLIFGSVKDKDTDAVFSLFPKQAIYYFTAAHIPRAIEADILQEKAKKFGLSGSTFDDVNQALKTALLHASENDLVVICGSIFLVAEVTRSSVAHYA